MRNAHARRREVQKSVAEFEKSIAEHQSYFWDQEGLKQSNSNACPRINITAVSEGEEDRDLLLYLENMDPCVDIDDHLPEQVNKFLEAFQKHLDQGNSQEPLTGTVQIYGFSHIGTATFTTLSVSNTDHGTCTLRAINSNSTCN